MAHNGAEDSLEVEGRANRLTDLAQRSQFADRLRQLARPRLQFLEQAYVLNGDHCLVSEGFKELDLRRGEGVHLGATCAQESNEVLLLTKRNGQEGAPADGSYCRQLIQRFNVANVERTVLKHPAIVWLIKSPHDAIGYGTRLCTRNYRVPLAKSQHHIINPTNPCRALDDGIHHWLHICRL